MPGQLILELTIAETLLNAQGDRETWEKQHHVLDIFSHMLAARLKDTKTNYLYTHMYVLDIQTTHTIIRRGTF